MKNELNKNSEILNVRCSIVQKMLSQKLADILGVKNVASLIKLLILKKGIEILDIKGYHEEAEVLDMLREKYSTTKTIDRIYEEYIVQIHKNNFGVLDSGFAIEQMPNVESELVDDEIAENPNIYYESLNLRKIIVDNEEMLERNFPKNSVEILEEISILLKQEQRSTLVKIFKGTNSYFSFIVKSSVEEVEEMKFEDSKFDDCMMNQESITHDDIYIFKSQSQYELAEKILLFLNIIEERKVLTNEDQLELLLREKKEEKKETLKEELERVKFHADLVQKISLLGELKKESNLRW